MEWWGFSKDHGWVVLDRSIPANRPGIREDLLFFRCKDLTMIVEKREKWNPPLYTFAPNYIRTLAPEASVEAAAEFETLQTRWPEFQREIQREQRETEERAEALRAQEEEKRKQAAREKKNQGAAANP